MFFKLDAHIWNSNLNHLRHGLCSKTVLNIRLFSVFTLMKLSSVVTSFSSWLTVFLSMFSSFPLVCSQLCKTSFSFRHALCTQTHTGISLYNGEEKNGSTVLCFFCLFYFIIFFTGAASCHSGNSSCPAECWEVPLSELKLNELLHLLHEEAQFVRWRRSDVSLVHVPDLDTLRTDTEKLRGEHLQDLNCWIFPTRKIKHPYICWYINN